MAPEVHLADLIAALGGDLIGEAQTRISRIAPLDEADGQTISFLANPRYQAQLAQTNAACVIVAPAFAEAAAKRGEKGGEKGGERGGAVIVTPDPYLYFARLTQWWAARSRPLGAARIHPSAVVDPSARLGAGVDVGPLAVIEAEAEIGDGARIGAHCVIAQGARIGAGTRLAARVTVGFGCELGQRCIVHSGVVIGADGFGFAPNFKSEQPGWEKIEQLGNVRIGNDVEIGANTCIDRGALADTVLEDGVKLDNLIQIAHNVQIGRHTAIAGCAAIAGSTKIGAFCTIGGAANVVGHLVLADHVHVSAATLISRSISQPGQYSGVYPFEDNASWEKNAATLRQLHSLRTRLRDLEKKNT
ncbi:UDP-3-O-(3-hydroxymyristoyl)glucosamine N-acyltransferase [Paucibacter sp. KBW04]|uniref:UDP-3-O-(3-hydroxymyristoyl)glucosamine N-acyltransferase n=1 Tax=Paucibacter sp. KBW04 TaxID=2153361 RepID=UPI000F57C410|nr:UDP-3-O-(3-hydroxymyristoyl)glucosamine N-acyltransferase [Paucibacter sp. KBW04]RQO63632.1 UDP-3-O-(3-hydroxymyristoyl)glucosamine N-acyltransferase [Paucibacter sp. KBW04]